jgi:hypothetical protein
MIPRVLCKSRLNCLTGSIRGGVSRVSALCIAPVPRLKKAVYDIGKSGYIGSAVKNNAKCVQGIDDEMRSERAKNAQ